MSKQDEQHKRHRLAEATGFSGLAVWKKGLLAGALAFMGVGGGLQLLGDDSRAPERSTVAESGDGESSAGGDSSDALGVGQGFVPLDPPRDGSDPSTDPNSEGATGGATIEADDGERGVSDWAPFFLKGGFGFFVGFCIGHFLRTFFKLSAIFCGFLALVLLVLQYTGVIDVDWDTISSGYDKAVAAISEETRQFWAFVQGSLPSMAAGVTGLSIGFKRN